MTSQFFLSHLQVLKISLLTRYYLENLCELINLIQASKTYSSSSGEHIHSETMGRMIILLEETKKQNHKMIFTRNEWLNLCIHVYTAHTETHKHSDERLPCFQGRSRFSVSRSLYCSGDSLQKKITSLQIENKI